MGRHTKIGWCDATVNLLGGCDEKGPECDNCYAREYTALRAAKNPMPAFAPYKRLAVVTADGRTQWTGEVHYFRERLWTARAWKTPLKIFLNDFSDTFHRGVPDAWIDEMVSMMETLHWHTWQVLTKRIRRARQYIAAWSARTGRRFPRNIWIGTTAGTQKILNVRARELAAIDASVRFLSIEPLLEALTLRTHSAERECEDCCGTGIFPGTTSWCVECAAGHDYARIGRTPPPRLNTRLLDWVIVGGESGTNARPCDVAWIRSIVAQCRAAEIPVYTKQLGADVRDRNDAGFDGADEFSQWDLPDPIGQVVDNPDGVRAEYQGAPVRIRLRNRKGNDTSEWPADLRIREFPNL